MRVKGKANRFKNNMPSEPLKLMGLASSTGIQAQHPLLNEDILENIFKYIINSSAAPNDISNDVRNFRQVCKAWKNASTRLYRRTPSALVKFGSFGRINSDRLNMHDRMQSYMDTMGHTEIIPIQRYSFIGDFFFAFWFLPMANEFLFQFGPGIVSLNFHCYDLDDSDTFDFELKSFLNLNLSMLKTLDFTFETLRKVKTPNPAVAYFLGSLLNASDLLEELTFKINLTFTKSAQRHALIKQFDEIICPCIPKTVKVLRLKTLINDNTLRTLMANGLKLEEFEFGASSISDNNELYQEFFECQASTLKILRVSGLMALNTIIPTTALIDLPRLMELSYLELEDKIVSPFCFADTFPKLRILDIGKWSGEGTTCLELLSYAEKTPALSVEEIHMPDCFTVVPLIGKVAKLFPNLQVIHIGPSPDIVETLREVFVHLNDLLELHITFPRDVQINADSIFTGLCKHQCELIQRAANFDEAGNLELQWTHHPSILNLTKLKKLTLKMDDLSWERVVLTDISAHFIFLKMTDLELRLTESQMSQKYITLLKKNLQLKIG